MTLTGSGLGSGGSPKSDIWRCHPAGRTVGHREADAGRSWGGEAWRYPRPGAPGTRPGPSPGHWAEGQPHRNLASQTRPPQPRTGRRPLNRWKRPTAMRPPPSVAGPSHSPPILLLRQLHPQAQTTAPYSPCTSSDALPCRSRPLHNSRASASTPGLPTTWGRGGFWEL